MDQRYDRRGDTRGAQNKSLGTQRELAPGKRTLAEQLPVQRRPDSGAAITRPETMPAPRRPRSEVMLEALFGIQRSATPAAGEPGQVQAAGHGAETAAAMPEADALRRVFGHRGASSMKAHTGADTPAAGQIPARADITGDRGVLGEQVDPHASAHEAAPVVQQRAGGQHLAGAEREGAATKIEPVESPQVARQASGRQAGGAPAPERVITAAQRGGQALSPGLREMFEPQFGHDLRDVRVHTDGEAAAAAASIEARAYTIGDHIVFGDGQYRPDARHGQHLLAHELTHVVQQRGGSRATQRAGAESATGDAAARLARAIAQLSALHTLVAPMAVTSGEGAAQVALLAEGLARLRAALAGGDTTTQAHVLDRLAAHLPPGMVDGIDGRAAPASAPIVEARAAGVAMAGLAVSQVGDAAEQEAEHVADAVTAGAPVHVNAAPRSMVHRDGEGNGGDRSDDWEYFAVVVLLIVRVLLAMWAHCHRPPHDVADAIREAQDDDSRIPGQRNHDGDALSHVAPAGTGTTQNETEKPPGKKPEPRRKKPSARSKRAGEQRRGQRKLFPNAPSSQPEKKDTITEAHNETKKEGKNKTRSDSETKNDSDAKNDSDTKDENKTKSEDEAKANENENENENEAKTKEDESESLTEKGDASALPLSGGALIESDDDTSIKPAGPTRHTGAYVTDLLKLLAPEAPGAQAWDESVPEPAEPPGENKPKTQHAEPPENEFPARPMDPGSEVNPPGEKEVVPRTHTESKLNANATAFFPKNRQPPHGPGEKEADPVKPTDTRGSSERRRFPQGGSPDDRQRMRAKLLCEQLRRTDKILDPDNIDTRENEIEHSTSLPADVQELELLLEVAPGDDVLCIQVGLLRGADLLDRLKEVDSELADRMKSVIDDDTSYGGDGVIWRSNSRTTLQAKGVHSPHPLEPENVAEGRMVEEYYPFQKQLIAAANQLDGLTAAGKSPGDETPPPGSQLIIHIKMSNVRKPDDISGYEGVVSTYLGKRGNEYEIWIDWADEQRSVLRRDGDRYRGHAWHSSPVDLRIHDPSAWPSL